MEDNITSLLAFIEPRGQLVSYHDNIPHQLVIPGQTEADNKRIKSSVACRYVLMLLIVILQGSFKSYIVQLYINMFVKVVKNLGSLSITAQS